MSESERRRKYRYNRVLIESARILTPQFADSVVYLTGPQIEMLRNVTQYLNRLDTYVEEHHSGYYLTPDAADYDDILEIVADLEEVLMGNPNTIWGYDDRLMLNDGFDAGGAGDQTVTLFTVPAGYVYEINLLGSRNADKVVDHQPYVFDGGIALDLGYFEAHPANRWSIINNLQVRLKEGDQIRTQFLDCDGGDTLRVRCCGYRMKVPE